MVHLYYVDIFKIEAVDSVEKIRQTVIGTDVRLVQITRHDEFTPGAKARQEELHLTFR